VDRSHRLGCPNHRLRYVLITCNLCTPCLGSPIQPKHPNVNS
jgi:hypothetical protein